MTACVICGGPVGQHVQRWTPGRKAQVVAKVLAGGISFADALEQFDLSAEELQGWIDREQKHGRRGLKVGALQALR